MPSSSSRAFFSTSASTGRKRPSKSLLAVLTLACLTTITVDYQRDESSPFEPARTALGDVLGPVQERAAVVARPLHEIPGFFEANQSLRADIAKLQAENANLRGEIATTSELRYRAAELDGLLQASRTSGVGLVPARVIAVGPAQSFSYTVTIDAGTSSGIVPDMTVINNEGLVGRVTEASRSSATVLLVIDQESVVGARLGSNAEVGFLQGRGDIGGDGRLDLDLVDNHETPGKNDVVVTFGSRNGAPYVAGVPIGSVEAVFSSPREQAKHAVIRPFVDFSSLDLVGVVVNDDTEGDRPIIRAGELPAETDAQEGGR
jgi:rod shape-determining protein MreC